MNPTHTTETDYREMQPVAIVRLLRGMVAMRNDKRFMSREQVDVEAMTEQADVMYFALIHHGFTPAQVTELVPGVGAFA